MDNITNAQDLKNDTESFLSGRLTLKQFANIIQRCEMEYRFDDEEDAEDEFMMAITQAKFYFNKKVMAIMCPEDLFDLFNEYISKQ